MSEQDLNYDERDQAISDRDQTIADRDLTIEQLGIALDRRATTAAAVGFVMGRLGMDFEAAFEYLLRLSSTRNVKLVEIARQIVETRSVPN